MNLILEDQCNRSGDEDSLFGSPPPSPTRGRSPSLALPYGSGTQNVGTIALPGSHNYSELPVNPLASSWCHAPELISRPPASTPTPTQPQHANTVNYPPPPCSKPKPAPSAKKKRSNAKAPVDRPRLPPIHLPDPAEPPPANFLRNQQTLLGMAGLVGGVNLSTRSTQRQRRGSTSANPIVVEDEHDPPPLGRFPPPVDPAILPIPSSEQIIRSLIKQKNIFPVLESIFKLAFAGDSQNLHLSTYSSFDRLAPSRKKRKLMSVPAGAVDWDVPYPFLQGEGPEAYWTNWEKERGRQLIMHLVGLIKSAVKKAATKTYSEQQRQLESGMGMPQYGHLSTPTLNQTPTIPDSSNDNMMRPLPYDTCPSPTPSAQTPESLEQLLASFLSSDATFAPATDIQYEPTSPESDQLSYHSWMTMLDALSYLETQEASSAQSSSSRDSSIPASVHAPSPSPHPIDPSNLVIDPTLLAISGQEQSLTCNDDVPLLLHSPIQSTSSSAEPLTPGWEAQFPDPEIYSGEQGVFGRIFPSCFPSQITANTVAVENPLVAGNGTCSQQPHNTSIITSKPSTKVTPEASKCQTTTAVTTRFQSVGKPREEIIRKAKERRSQLLAEMERAKVELWETTIEQGVLVQIVHKI
jgi:hypothetical protein